MIFVIGDRYFRIVGDCWKVSGLLGRHINCIVFRVINMSRNPNENDVDIVRSEGVESDEDSLNERVGVEWVSNRVERGQ